jgi:sedoheptulokinase
MKAIGIDIGTTTIGGAVIDTAGKEVIFSKNIVSDAFFNTSDPWEKIQDTEKIIKNAKALLDELLCRYPDTVSIGLTGQMHGILYVDDSGKALSPLFTWQDGRGDLVQPDGMSLTEEIFHMTGKKVSTGYGLITHIYNIRHGLVPQNASKIMTVPDYFGSVLTGNKDIVMHAGMAASLGFFDVEKGEFCLEELEKYKVLPGILPEVSRKVTVLGKYRDIPVTSALGDNQASYLGTVRGRENVILINVGTGGQISAVTQKYVEIPEIETRPYLDDTYLLAGSALCSGRAYALLEKFFRSFMKAASGTAEEQYGTMDFLARAGKAQKDRILVDTRFAGTRSNAGLRGSITGISEYNFTPEALAYGVIEGIVRELYSYYDAMQKKLDLQNPVIMASGNGIRKNKVMQETASEMFGTELVLSQGDEEAAKGAAVSSLCPGGIGQR